MADLGRDEGRRIVVWDGPALGLEGARLAQERAAMTVKDILRL